MKVGICVWCNEEIEGHEAYLKRVDQIDEEVELIHFHCLAEESDCENF